jgi:hypothetical protein
VVCAPFIKKLNKYSTVIYGNLSDIGGGSQAAEIKYLDYFFCDAVEQTGPYQPRETFPLKVNIFV